MARGSVSGEMDVEMVKELTLAKPVMRECLFVSHWECSPIAGM